MNKRQVKAFTQLLEDENFKGKKQLEHLLWLNTSKPKYKIGDCVTITNLLHSIFGHQVIEFKGKVAEIYSFNDSNEWHYRIEMVVICEGKQTVVNEYALESDIECGATDNFNLLHRGKNIIKGALGGR